MGGKSDSINTVFSLLMGISMWEALIKRYWQICIFKDTPEHTPYSPLLLLLAAFLFFWLIIFEWSLVEVKQPLPLITSLFAGLSLLVSCYLYTFVLMKVYKKTNRTLQTLTSLLFCHFIIQLFALPLLLIEPLLISADMEQGGTVLLVILYLILSLMFGAWQFLVTAKIYKDALELDYFASILASFGLLAVNILIVSFW